MPVLLLIRHGENDYLTKGILVGDMPGVALNARGLEQAVALRETLRSLPVQAIYSSPLQRAIETAEPLAQALGMKIQVRAGLKDTDVGAWAGREIKELRRLKEWKMVQRAPSTFCFPGGETFVELQSRLVAEIEVINSLHTAMDMVAVFFHADPIKLVLAHYLGMPLDHFQKLNVDTGSISILALGRKGAILHSLNLKPPLEGNLLDRR